MKFWIIHWPRRIVSGKNKENKDCILSYESFILNKTEKISSRQRVPFHGNSRQFLVILGNFRTFFAILCYSRPFSPILAHSRPFSAIPGHSWPFLAILAIVILWQFFAILGNFRQFLPKKEKWVITEVSSNPKHLFIFPIQKVLRCFLLSIV